MLFGLNGLKFVFVLLLVDDFMDFGLNSFLGLSFHQKDGERLESGSEAHVRGERVLFSFFFDFPKLIHLNEERPHPIVMS